MQFSCDAKEPQHRVETADAKFYGRHYNRSTVNQSHFQIGKSKPASAYHSQRSFQAKDADKALNTNPSLLTLEECSQIKTDMKSK
jgi:hypothetical protein